MFEDFKGQRSAVYLFFKYCLFFTNFLVFVASGLIIGLMAWVIDQKEKNIRTALDFFLDPPCVLLTAACVAIVVSFLGWFGPLRENILGLRLYRWLMAFLLLAEMALVIFIFVIVYMPDSRRQLNIYPEEALEDAIVRYREDEDRQNLVDGIQEQLKCCGLSDDDEGYKDWTINPYFNCSRDKLTAISGEYCSVPFSCCIPEEDGKINFLCGQDMQRPDTDPSFREETIYTRGCFKALTMCLTENTLVVGGVMLGVVIPQILFACMASRLTYNILQTRMKEHLEVKMTGRKGYPNPREMKKKDQGGYQEPREVKKAMPERYQNPNDRPPYLVYY